MAPFAEGGAYGIMSTSSSGSEDGGGGGDGSTGSRRRKRGGGDGGGKACRSSKSSSSGGGRHLPPRDGMSRAAARAARMEADKLAALRHFVSEAKLETSRSSRSGGAVAADAAAETATRGRGRPRSGSGGAPLLWNDTEEEDAQAEMARIDPPLLPSGELLPEDSKAFKVLGAGGGGGSRVRSFSGSSLPSALVTTSRSEEFDVGSLRGKLARRGDNKPSPGPSPPLHPRLIMEGAGRTVDGRPLSLSLASFDIGAGTASKVAEQWAACNSVVPTPHGGTTRRADPPLSPGAQTPPPLSPPGVPIADLGRLGGGGDGGEHHGSHQQKHALRSPLSARGGPGSHWANTTAEEAEAAAAAVSPPGWGARKGFLSSGHSPASTPRLGGSSSTMWGGNSGAGKKAEERGGGGSGSLGNKTPVRLPRRLHQGVNKVKRAVGVG